MSDAADERVEGVGEGADDGGPDENASDHEADEGEAGEADDGGAGDGADDVEALRREVEEKYDFDEFGPADMAEMTAEEWDAVFDPETWTTGEELLDRVEADLKSRVAERDVFARIERHDDRVVAYSDEGYATVYGDGSVEGRGTVLRDVKPTVALCSMDSYDVPDSPSEDLLPEPREVPEGSGELGNTVIQVVAGFQVLAGVVLIGSWFLIWTGIVAPPGGGSVRSLNVIGMLVAGVFFLGIGLLLFLVVANARLSDKFRAEEYRNRLRAVGLEPGERPEFIDEDGRVRLPDDDTDDESADAGGHDAAADRDGDTG